ncbi:Short-chain dehydrogenase [hydrothermal vent metagenome]|uniref:Short-chain dehydrogenase n=1 Tax=hydrothermal vent metagenome TaxID=652676 RepID=A0A3B1AIP5_9ZZZZ
MQSLWNDAEARACGEDALKLRVYTSRLLGREPSLVLHGGGNTSVKAEAENLFGDAESVLYVKGSGWDLATIEAGGFAPVRLDVLRRMAALRTLSDPQMVRAQRAAMTDPYAPNPSVEAILHAIIPFKFVDHTHADAVVTLTNTPDDEARIRALYGERVLVVPYVMPGFVLAKKVWEMTADIDWSRLDGMVLMNHGVFTFADDARASYERMIMLVSQAEEALAAEGATVVCAGDEADTPQPDDLLALSELRRVVSGARGAPVVVNWDRSAEARGFSARDKVADIATRGPLTPDHVIRTKRVPLVVREGAEADSARYANEYRAYFERNATPDLTCLDPAPRWAVWPGHGTLAFGTSVKEAGIIADISRHTAAAIQRAECLGGWRALPERDIFEVEYWDLEQAKLRKASLSAGTQAEFAGKVALITGAASGIGRACADALHARGAAVVALDIDPVVTEHFSTVDRLGIVCDMTDSAAIQAAVAQAVMRFGGLDVVVSNAGNFPANLRIEAMASEVWERSLQLNLTAHQRLLQYCIPYLQRGLQPAVVLMASKNVLAPGPGAAAYSVAKAGLTQLGRVAALELAPLGIRVNMLHPDAVFDTGIWTDEVIASRARHYGMTVQEYKTKNLLKVEISAADVADMVCALAGPLFAKTTGEQLSIDGGNDRVI